VQVESSSGIAAFDEAARAWVLARWRFEAGPQRFRTRVPFRLAR
jgi:outer membrane biosynthesis protein TonB